MLHYLLSRRCSSAVVTTCLLLVAGTFGLPGTTNGQGYTELPPPLPPLDSPSYALPQANGNEIDLSALEAMASGMGGSDQGGMAGGLSDLPLTQGVIGSAIANENTIPVPVVEQRVAWYRKYPWMWIPMEGWNNSIEFGLNGSEGNSQTTSLQTGADLIRSTDAYTFAIDINYQRTQSGSLETQNNGRLNADFDRLLGDTAWSAFTKLGLEYDEFKAFDLRVNLNSGLGYYWLRNDKATLVTRFGAGASKEIGGPDDSWVPEALFGFEATRQLSERQKIAAKLEYYPQWDDWHDYRMVSDISWETLVDGVDNLSLKLALTNRYDSTPQGLEPNDLFYSALLLWKF